MLDLEPDARLHQLDVRVRLHLDVGAGGDLLDADGPHSAIILVQVAVGDQRPLRLHDRRDLPPRLLAEAQQKAAGAGLFENGFQPLGRARVSGGGVAVKAQRGVFDEDFLGCREELNLEAQVEDASPMAAQVAVAPVVVERGVAEKVVAFGGAEATQVEGEGLAVRPGEGVVAVQEPRPAVPVGEIDLRKAHLHDGRVRAPRVVEDGGEFDLAVVQVAQLRVAFQLQQGVVEAARRDRLRGGLHVGRRLIGKEQFVQLAPGVIAQVAGALLAENPGVAHRVQVDQQAPEIVGRGRVDRQDLTGAEKRLVGIRLTAVGRGDFRGEDVLDVPARPVGQVGDGVAERLQDGDARIVGVVIGPKGAPHLLDEADPFPAQAVVILGGVERGLFGYGHG